MRDDVFQETETIMGFFDWKVKIKNSNNSTRYLRFTVLKQATTSKWNLSFGLYQL